MSNDITPINTKPDEIKAAVERLTRYMDDQIAFEKLLAKINRAKFLALTSEGFSPSEALQIIIGPAR